MLNSDHLIVLTLAECTYEIPAKYAYKRHLVNTFIFNLNLDQIEFESNIFR